MDPYTEKANKILKNLINEGDPRIGDVPSDITSDPADEIDIRSILQSMEDAPYGDEQSMGEEDAENPRYNRFEVDVTGDPADYINAKDVMKRVEDEDPFSGEEDVIYSSDDGASEEDAENPWSGKFASQDIKAALPAIQAAQAMATAAASSGLEKLNPFASPQKRMNQAYGKLMDQISQRISRIKL